MYTKIQFTNEINMLENEKWGFIFMDGTLYLDDYKLKTNNGDLIKHYDRLDHNNYNRDVTIGKNDVPLTKVIKQQAKAGLFETIKVNVWDR